MKLLMPVLNDAHHAVLTAMWAADELFALDGTAPPAVYEGVMQILTDLLIATAPPELPARRKRAVRPSGPVMTGHEVPLCFGGDGGR